MERCSVNRWFGKKFFKTLDVHRHEIPLHKMFGPIADILNENMVTSE